MKFILKESLSTIYYTLFPSWDGSGEVDWEYDPTIEDEERFTTELMNKYSKDTLEDVVKEYLPSDYHNLSLEDQLSELKDIVFENLELFDEDAYDFFYDNAVEDYEEQSDYGSDNGSGMRPSDFY